MALNTYTLTNDEHEMSEPNSTGVLKKIPAFYTPKMVANFSNFSPSAGKPAMVVGAWQRLGLPIDIFEPEPVTAE